MKALAILILASAAFAPITQAASFNCAKAASKKEDLICADAGLSKLDDELGASFRRANARLGANNLAREWQREWLRSADVSGCDNAACLRKVWSARIAALDASIVSLWNGRYERFDNNKVDKNTAELVLVAMSGGQVSVAGTAISIRSMGSDGAPYANTGGFGGQAKTVGKKLLVDDDICHVELTVNGTRLWAEDNDQCGGQGVSFTGEYRRY